MEEIRQQSEELLLWQSTSTSNVVLWHLLCIQIKPFLVHNRLFGWSGEFGQVWKLD